MGKKDLASVTTDLSALASMMPTQKPVVAAPATVAQSTPPAALKVVPTPHQEEEEVIQFSLSMRKELRKQLARLAACRAEAFRLISGEVLPARTFIGRLMVSRTGCDSV
jgi:hypothetical protein